jgi:cold shock CspA family protein
MIGTVCEANFGYAFISCPKGRIFCHATQMPIDEVGRRYLLPDEKVTFELGKHNGRTVASKVELCTPHEPVDIHSYLEEGQVQSVRANGGYAFISRPFGGVVMLNWRNVHRSCENRRGIDFFPGQQWRYRIAPPINGIDTLAWLAVDAEEILSLPQ